MIFEPTERSLLPTKDLLSFIFDDPPYDQDQPVSRMTLAHHPETNIGRSILTFIIPHVQFLVTKPGNLFVSLFRAYEQQASSQVIVFSFTHSMMCDWEPNRKKKPIEAHRFLDQL